MAAEFQKNPRLYRQTSQMLHRLLVRWMPEQIRCHRNKRDQMGRAMPSQLLVQSKAMRMSGPNKASQDKLQVAIPFSRSSAPGRRGALLSFTQWPGRWTPRMGQLTGATPSLAENGSTLS